jgi:hypothetical protein
MVFWNIYGRISPYAGKPDNLTNRTIDHIRLQNKHKYEKKEYFDANDIISDKKR